MKRSATILALLATLLLMSCDSTEPVDEPILAVEEKMLIPLEELLVGLWQKDDVEGLEWLFKEGGSYLAGDLNPINPIVGNWELEGDTLHINDSACFDAFATYRIGIDENAMSVELLLDECEGRGAVLPGGWSRFIYGQ